MKKTMLFAAAIACVMACHLCASCGPTAASEARNLIKSGDLKGAVEKAGEITSQSDKQSVPKEIVIQAMNAQKVTDAATVGINDAIGQSRDYSPSFAHERIPTPAIQKDQGLQEE